MSSTSAPNPRRASITPISHTRWPMPSKAGSSGEGMAITLNKHQGIRAGLVWDKQIAHLIRQHNNANVIVLPARFITNDQAVEFVEEFLATDFEGGRHQRRIEKIPVKACSRQ